MNPALRLTPSHSPFYKHSTPKSPTKSRAHEELGLRLKKVIGTTTTSANGFDCLPSARHFAFTAGAAAVVATVDEELNVTQRFFRAKPTATATNSQEGSSVWPASPTPNEARQRAFGSIGRQSLAGSPLGASSRDWSDSPSGKTSTARDRVKAATSIAISPNGKWLAMGQTGYSPAVLIFSLKDGSSETPVAIIQEHTFGVHALSWSPDSKYLASLGTVNDGFLFVWNVSDVLGAVSMHSSNKITTVTNDMVWLDRSIITVGLRSIKVWRPDDATEADLPGSALKASTLSPRIRIENGRGSEFGNSIMGPRHKPLSGKNSLLNDMLEANFVAVLPLSGSKAIICADSGEICLLNDENKLQSLTPITVAGFCISSARLLNDGSLEVLGAGSASKKFPLGDLVTCSRPLVKRVRRQSTSPTKVSQLLGRVTVAAAAIGNVAVDVTSDRMIKLRLLGPNVDGRTVTVAAHAGSVAGVQPVRSEWNPEAAFLTYSACGEVKLWDANGSTLSLVDVPVDSPLDAIDYVNELKAVSPFMNGRLLAAGDKLGVLTIIDLESKRVLTQVRAHSTEILELAVSYDSTPQLIATASRDRTVQLFAWRNDTLELLQTMDEHVGAVTGILFAQNDKQLISCSSDRSVVIREALLRDENKSASVAFAIVRTISVKTTPTSICSIAASNTLLVATMDKSIGQYNTETGRAGFGFKCTDHEGGDAVIMSKILYVPSLRGNPTIAGISSTDKSVRLYTEYGSLIARDYGHTEGITSMAFISGSGDSERHAMQLVTAAADTTIFIWDSSPDNAQEQSSEPYADSQTTLTPAAMGPPLRKVLSFSDLSRPRRNKSTEDGEALSPSTPSQPVSPKRLVKKSSRTSLAQAPKLEPAFRSGFANSSRRTSLRHRSPSPPSPRNTVKIKHSSRRASLAQLGVGLRSKSSEDVLTNFTSENVSQASSGKESGYGSLTSATESVCRNLRAYRKKLAKSPASDRIAPTVVREMEKELKLVVLAVAEKSQGTAVDDANMSPLLKDPSDKIAGMLDERIKERVQTEVRKNSDSVPPAAKGTSELEVVQEDAMKDEVDTLAGAIGRVGMG